MKNLFLATLIAILGFLNATQARAATDILEALRHACVAQYLEFGTYDRYHCEIDDVAGARTTLPNDLAVKYCSATRLLILLGEPVARDTELLACNTNFSQSSTYSDGSPVLDNGELLWPNRSKLLDADGNLWFAGGVAATVRDLIYYRGSGTLKSGTQWYYRSTVLFRVEDSFNHPNGRTAVTPRGILYYPSGIIAGAVDGGGIDIYYPNRNPARLNRQLYCPLVPAMQRGNTTGNLLADACTLKNICGLSSPEGICKTRYFLRPTPSLEALAALRLLAEVAL